MTKLLWTLPLLLLSLSPTLAEELNADERAAVEAEIQKRIKVTSEKMESPALAQVFAPTFIRVQLMITTPDGGTMTHDMTLVKSGEAFKEIETPTTNMPMPKLQATLRKDLRIKSGADAKVFEQALDAVYPVSEFGEAKKLKAVRHEGETWTFVRGKFFEKRAGFVVTTDVSGTIKDLRYSLDIPAE